jgi:hypothetical protein
MALDPIFSNIFQQTFFSFILFRAILRILLQSISGGMGRGTKSTHPAAEK